MFPVREQPGHTLALFKAVWLKVNQGILMHVWDRKRQAGLQTGCATQPLQQATPGHPSFQLPLLVACQYKGAVLDCDAHDLERRAHVLCTADPRRAQDMQCAKPCMDLGGLLCQLLAVICAFDAIPLQPQAQMHIVRF